MITRKHIGARMGRYRLGGSSSTEQKQPLPPTQAGLSKRAANDALALIQGYPIWKFAAPHLQKVAPLNPDHSTAFRGVRALNRPTAGLANTLRLNAPISQLAHSSVRAGNINQVPIQSALNQLGAQFGAPAHQMALSPGSPHPDMFGLRTYVPQQNVLGPGYGLTTTKGRATP